MLSKHAQRVSQQIQDLRPGGRYRFWFSGATGPGLLMAPLDRSGPALLGDALRALAARLPDATTGAVLVDRGGRPCFVGRGAGVALLRDMATWARAHLAEVPALAMLSCAAAADADVDPNDDAQIQALDLGALRLVRADDAWEGLLSWSVADTAAALADAAPGEKFHFWWSSTASVPLVVQALTADPRRARCRALVERALGTPWDSGWRGVLEVAWDGRLCFEVEGGRPLIWSESDLDAFRPDLAAARVLAALGDAFSPARILSLMSVVSTIPTLAGDPDRADADPGYGLMHAELPTLRGLARPRIELDVQEDVLRFCDGPRVLMELQCNRAELIQLRARLDDLGDASKPLFDADTLARAAALADPESIHRAVLNPAQNGAALDAMREIAAEQRAEVAARRAQAEVLRGLGDPDTLRVRVYEAEGSLAVGITRDGALLWSEDLVTGWRIRLAGREPQGAGEPEVLRALAAWVRAHVSACPELARLVGAYFTVRDQTDGRASTVDEPALWEGLIPQPAVGSLAYAASALKALRPEQNAWVWLTARDRLGDPFIALIPSSLASSKAATQERLRPLEARAATRGARMVGVLRRVPSGQLLFFTEGDPREAAEALVAVAARWGVSHPALAELDMASVARLTDGELTETASPSGDVARARRLGALAAAQGALLDALSAEARPFFWLSTDADDGAPLLLLDEDSKALMTTLKGLKSLLNTPDSGPTAVQGRARLLPDQPAVFVVKSELPGFDAALNTWIDAHADDAPGLGALRGAQVYVRA